MRKLNFATRLPVLMLLLLSFCFQFNWAYGQTEGSDSQVGDKLLFLKTALLRDHNQVNGWWYGWLAGYSTATVGQGVIGFSTHNVSLKQDMILGASTTILGAAGQFISPFIPNNEFDSFTSLPEKTKDDRIRKLAAAEELLRQWSEKERLALTWQNHILCTSVNIAGGLITWLGFKRTFKDGLINFAINTVVTETQIWSQPTLARRQYKKYCQRYFTGVETYSNYSDVNWYIQAKPNGMGLKIIF